MDRSESDIISSNPINLELEYFRRTFRSRCNDLGITECQDTSTQVGLWIGDGSTDSKIHILGLLAVMISLPAAWLLQSRIRSGDLSGDIALFYVQINTDAVDVEITIPLLTKIIKLAPDVAIWDAAFALVAFRHRADTPPNIFDNVEPDTPLKSSTSSQQGSDQTHADMDTRILQEINLCTYHKTKGFFQKYFEDKEWSSAVASFAQEVDQTIINGRWDYYPHPPTQTAVLEWFEGFQSKFPLERNSTYYTSFNKSLDGSGCNRKPDLFLAPIMRVERHHWRDVRVIGELKAGISNSYVQEIAQFCGYAREVFANQPTRRYLHGFVLRGAIMELWVFDRSGPYNCEKFDAHKDPNRFIKVIVGYAMMSDEELGLDTFIKQDKIGKWIMFKGDGEANEERLELENQPIAFQRAIVCRGTTCYRAKRQGANHWEFVVKFSWRSDKRRAEGKLLELAKKKKVWGVAELFGHQDIVSIANLRQGLQFGNPQSFPRSKAVLNQTQPILRSVLFKNNQFPSPSLSRSSITTNLPSVSSLGQKRKRSGESTATSQSKWSRANDSRRQEIMIAGRTASNQPDVQNTVEETKLTSVVPPKDDGSFDNRILCCLVVFPPGRAIDQFKSIQEFLEACRDVIKGHRSLYQDAMILHRDVSKNNIIITDAKNEVDPRGMLIDLDLAKELDSGPSGVRYRTGTREFMAIEVLEGHNHTYRHDVESFFYVFLWVIIQYNPEGRGEKNLAWNSKLRSWYTGSYGNIADAKRSLMDPFHFSVILDEFPHELDGLKELAKALRRALFSAWPQEGLFTGTFGDSNNLYTPMVEAFDKVIAELNLTKTI